MKSLVEQKTECVIMIRKLERKEFGLKVLVHNLWSLHEKKIEQTLFEYPAALYPFQFMSTGGEKLAPH